MGRLVSFPDSKCGPAHEFSGMRHLVGMDQPFACFVRESEVGAGGGLSLFCGRDQSVTGLCREWA